MFAGSLTEPIPADHVLIRIDRVLDLGWLRAEVADCVAAGIAKGEVVHIGSTPVRADASREAIARRHADAVEAANGAQHDTRDVEARGIEAVIPAKAEQPPRRGTIPVRRFKRDARHRVVRCPAGKVRRDNQVAQPFFNRPRRKVSPSCAQAPALRLPRRTRGGARSGARPDAAGPVSGQGDSA